MIYIGTQTIRFPLSHKLPSKGHCQIPVFPAPWHHWGVSLSRREDPSHSTPLMQQIPVQDPSHATAPGLQHLSCPALLLQLTLTPGILDLQLSLHITWECKSLILEKKYNLGKDKTIAKFIISPWKQMCPGSWWSRSCCAPHSPGPLLPPCRMGSLWAVRHKVNRNFHWQVPQLLHFCIILIVLHNTDKGLFFHLAGTNQPLSNTPRQGSFLPSPAPCFLHVYLRKIWKWLASL